MPIELEDFLFWKVSQGGVAKAFDKDALHALPQKTGLIRLCDL